MKKGLLYLILIFIGNMAMGQDMELRQGRVSYKSGQHIYVAFESTVGISAGDTLFMVLDEERLPALVVKNRSSLSCVCEPLPGIDLELGDSIFFQPVFVPLPVKAEAEPADTLVQRDVLPADSVLINDSLVVDNKIPEQHISGRISVSSYADLSDAETRDNFKMRYVVSLNAANINDSRLTFDTYIAFSHRNDEWDEIRDNIYNGLKIYQLSLNYKLNDATNLWFGRRINPKVSSMGAIDGLQFEKKIRSFTLGAIVGSHPDWSDYSFNFDLFQAGIYAYHEYASPKINLQNTLAVVDQEYQWKTDRRFLYLQHTSRLFKKMYFFASGEFDLYKKINQKQENTFDLSNLYLRFRYRASRYLSFSASYSARNNLILYETYQSFIEKLLETETLQGYSLGVNARPFKNISAGIKAGYRDRGGDVRPSRNIYGYVRFNRLPLWGLTAGVNALFLETSYLKSRVFGLRLSKDFFSGKLFGSLGYRNVNYDYLNQDYVLDQNCFELNLNFKMKWQMYASLNYESNFDKDLNYYRVYINLTKRF